MSHSRLLKNSEGNRDGEWNFCQGKEPDIALSLVVALSSAEASLCCREAGDQEKDLLERGRRKRERAGHDGKGKERREATAFSLFPSFPRAFYFSIYC